VKTALDDFWAPALHDQHLVPICTGVVVFAPKNYSGVITAGKDAEYPFISCRAHRHRATQALLDRSGATTQLESAATTPLTELREHPVILLGAYNNQWTLRCFNPCASTSRPIRRSRSSTSPSPDALATRRVPALLQRDDYAVVAGSVTPPPTVGGRARRSGPQRTEAAAEFATSPHYMQLLRDRIGADFANRNLELCSRSTSSTQNRSAIHPRRPRLVGPASTARGAQPLRNDRTCLM